MILNPRSRPQEQGAVLQKLTIEDISLRSNFLDLSTPESRFEFLVSSKSKPARVSRAVAIERALFPSDIYISGKIEEGFKLSDFVERFNENGSTTTFGRYISAIAAGASSESARMSIIAKMFSSHWAIDGEGYVLFNPAKIDGSKGYSMKANLGGYGFSNVVSLVRTYASTNAEMVLITKGLEKLGSSNKRISKKIGAPYSFSVSKTDKTKLKVNDMEVENLPKLLFDLVRPY